MKADANGKKEILILGGTRFFGPALIEKLLESSGKAIHITCFHRGLHNAAFPCSEVSFLTGDRYSSRDMAELFEREWDTVIDLSGTDEQTITAAMQYACGRCRRYVFISSSSVYAPGDLSPHREDEPLKNGTGEPYAIAKINGERLMRELFPCHTIIRPSKVYGPGNYWFSERDYLKRLQDSPLVCLKNDPVLHFTYISDLAEGICALLDKNGTFNVAGAEPASLSRFIKTIGRLYGITAAFAFTQDSDVPFSGLSDRILDLSEAKKAAGWFPTVSLEEGLARTLLCSGRY